MNRTVIDKLISLLGILERRVAEETLL